MTSAQLVPAAIVSLLAWRVYSRVKRNIGRQHYEPRRVVTRLLLVSVFSALVAVGAGFYHPIALAGLGGGLAIGIPLALWAVHLTRFEDGLNGRFYTPNTHIGLAVTLIFIGRVLYRIITLTMVAQSAGHGIPPQPGMFESPLTLFCYGITAGYYVVYLLGVRNRMQKMG